MRPVAATRGTSPLLPVLTLLCALGFAAPPHGDAAPVSGNITLSFTSNTLDVAALWLLNVVNKRNLAFSVPPQEMTGVIVGDMRVENITAGSLSLKMMSPNKISVVLQNVSTDVPLTRFTTTGGFSCDGVFIAKLVNSSLSVTMEVTALTSGRVNTSISNVTIAVGGLQMGFELLGLCSFFTNWASSMFQQAVVNVKSSLENDMPHKVKPMGEKMLNSFFGALPILLVDDPIITDESALLSFTVLGNGTANDVSWQEPANVTVNETSILDNFAQSARVIASTARAESSSSEAAGNETVNESSSAASDPLQPPLPDRDIAVVASFAALNNLMRLAVNRTNVSLTLPIPSAFNTSIVRAMYPEVYALCPDCPFALSVALKAAPQVSARPESLLVLNATNCSLTLLAQPPKGDAVSALDVLLSADVPVMELAFVDEAHLRTKLGPMNLTIDVLSSVIRPIFTDTLEGDLQWIIDRVLIPILNGNTAGIPLPFKLSKPVLNVTDSQVVFAYDVFKGCPRFPFLFIES
ncbi:LBP BPI CETP family C terminal domain [Trypanosoma vivax]|nr:LBP BPI CETP family C terminal domain [Trypanosoma vivax]